MGQRLKKTRRGDAHDLSLAQAMDLPQGIFPIEKKGGSHGT